jgi:hypothetical protein
VPLLIALVAVLAVGLGVVAWLVRGGGDDPKAEAEKFMTAVQKGDFAASEKLLCKDGRGRYSDAAELENDLADGDIMSFTLGSVSDTTYQGGKRKDVEVAVQRADGSTKRVHLSMTREKGKYLVCGF